MRCPKCGTEMRRVGLGQVVSDKVFVSLECPGCHYRTEQEQKRPGRQSL